jgi:myo-inositol-1(or 4)-monophosphatase
VQFDQSAEAGPLGLGIRRAGSAALLVQEAGGVITDGEGGQGWLDSGNLVVGTPGVARELLESLES